MSIGESTRIRDVGQQCATQDYTPDVCHAAESQFADRQFSEFAVRRIT